MFRHLHSIDPSLTVPSLSSVSFRFSNPTKTPGVNPGFSQWKAKTQRQTRIFLQPDEGMRDALRSIRIYRGIIKTALQKMAAKLRSRAHCPKITGLNDLFVDQSSCWSHQSFVWLFMNWKNGKQSVVLHWFGSFVIRKMDPNPNMGGVIALFHNRWQTSDNFAENQINHIHMYMYAGLKCAVPI